ncbi:MAG: SDR family oxidoreductase [Nitrospirae bacterium]|nr:SDR family oxidoreductase [Nitrospirota bacterium]
MQQDYFKDKTALITGSSRGIGSAIARKLALAGADIVLNYRKAGGASQEQGEQLCKEIQDEESGGKIVFISSLGSRFYNPSYPLGSMKAAMESVVRDSAESLKEKGITVNGVCGGIVRTDSFKVLRQYIEEIELMPEEMIMEPEEIADTVLFLCSPESRGIRGQTIVVDRGLSSRLLRSPKKS